MKIALCVELSTLKRHTLDRVISNASVVEHFLTGRSLYRSLKTGSWDMVIIGWSLSDMDGIELLRWIKATYPTLPLIVFVSSQGTDRNVIAALDYGADDFIIEPVTEGVVRARIEAVAHRAGRIARVAPVPETVTFGQYVFHIRHQYIEVSGQRVALRPKEYALAVVFFENLGRPLTREFLHRTIWRSDENIPSRTLDTHLSRLRAQLRQITNNAFKIVAVYGIGYRLVDTTLSWPDLTETVDNIDPAEANELSSHSE